MPVCHRGVRSSKYTSASPSISGMRLHLHELRHAVHEQHRAQHDADADALR